MQTTFTVDLSSLKPHQREAFLALIRSFNEPCFIRTWDERHSDETAAIQ
jgi:hypothetical protein